MEYENFSNIIKGKKSVQPLRFSSLLQESKWCKHKTIAAQFSNVQVLVSHKFFQ